MLGVPVVTLICHGHHVNSPFWNLHERNVAPTEAEMSLLFTPQDLKDLPVDELNRRIVGAFQYDDFAWQKENNVLITEPDRAEGLDRILYKCPHCLTEGKTVGKGDTLTCESCGKTYTLTQTGEMQAVDGNTEIAHIPDWYAWERACVKEELVNGKYLLDTDVDIYVLATTKCLYSIGKGRLVHNTDGFKLYDEKGELLHEQAPLFSYSINADFFWYEIGDVVYIGNNELTYCCVPLNLRNVVAKTRLAAEELYKLSKRRPTK
jgi:hypothetical protein